MVMVKHSALRTAILYKNLSRPLQLVYKERTAECECIDLRGSNEETGCSLTEEIRKEDLSRNFNLEKDPLIRMKYIKLSSDRHIMLLTFHHIIIDGWCMTAVLGDILNTYEKLNSGRMLDIVEKEIINEAENKPKYSEYIKYLGQVDKEPDMNTQDNLKV